MNPAAEGENRFDNDAQRYADYLQTPEGRLRADLTFANVQEFLPARSRIEPLCALDIGCGTGATAVRLALLGMNVTLFDSSPAMLELAKKTISEAGVCDKVTFQCGDAARSTDFFPAKSFDLILCHNVLEYVDSPHNVLRGAGALMRDSAAILSVLVRNQAGEVLKAAIQTGDLAAAERDLTAEWERESLYQGKVRLFTPETLQSILEAASLRIIVRRGVRVVSDYLPAKIARSTEFESILSLEQKLGQRQEFFGIARYLHLMARPEVLPSEANG